MTFDLPSVVPYLGDIVQGLELTVELFAISLFLGALLGLGLALLRVSRYKLAIRASAAFVDFFNATPVLVQLFWLYYVLPEAFGLRLPDLVVLSLALSLNVSAVLAENYRAGLRSVDPGQREAAQVLGLSKTAVFLAVIVPQALRVVLPMMANTSISLLKDTSLATFIGVNDLMNSGRNVAIDSYRPIEVFTIVAVVYFFLTYPLSILTGIMERRRQWARPAAV